MSFKEKSKDKTVLQEVCSTCNKPIREKAQSNVTRFLFAESRCVCPASHKAPSEDMHTPDIVDVTSSKLSKEAVIENLGDRYEVQDLLGRGGMGAVYKVRDKELNKTFAIKVLNAELVEDKNSLKRFEQEAKAASGLTSPNLVAVYDFGMGKKGSPYIVMDYLDGTSLDVVIQKEGYVDVPRAIDIFVQIAEAVTHAHAKSVIHRDIKPSNIILTKGVDNADFVKLVDFGIAKVLPSEQKATQNLTQTGDIFGSPIYMSPEQCLGNKLDTRSDIYAFGCVMYETLTGTAPFAAENPIKTILKHINDDPKPISALPQDYKVPPPLEAIVMRCLAKDPIDRYQTATELMRDLEAVRDGKKIKIYKPQAKPDHQHQKLFRRITVYTCLSISAVICLLVLTQKPNPNRGLNALTDASQFDNLSFQYFMNKDYEKAIPLLEFGISAYKGNNPFYLADNYQHIGKCYKELGKYDKAVGFYEKALAIYCHEKKTRPGYGMEAEARSDYADVLRHLGQSDKARLVASGQYEPTSTVEPAPNIKSNE